MAYKFQFGASVMSGSLTQEGDVTVKDGGLGLPNGGIIGNVAVEDLITLSADGDVTIKDGAYDFDVASHDGSNGLKLGGVLVTATAAELNVLDGLAQGSILLGDGSGAAAITDIKTSGRILVGNGTTAASVAVSGDATLAAGGALTIANDAVNNDKLANIARGSVKVGGAANAPTDLDAKTSGQILVGDGTDIASVAVSGDATLAANGTVTLAAAQTNITSLLATDIKIGEDDQTKIDFETPDKIHFYANNVKELVLEADKLTPGANDGLALGDSSLGFSDLYLADSGVVYMGNDQDVKLIHVPDSGVTLESKNDGDSQPSLLTLRLSSSSPADNDQVGALYFGGYDDAENAEVFAGIRGVATDVSNTSESGGIEFVVIQGGSVGMIMDINKTAANTVTVADGSYDFNVASHDGTNGLKLGGTLVTATAAQINQLQTGAVTSVTSLLATDIKIGEDDQTKIDFEDANKINFYANNAKELVLEENKLTPGTNDGIALGDTSLGFSDLYLADGGAIEFGNDQDSKIVWDSADKLQVNSAIDDFVFELFNSNAGASGTTFRFAASSSSPADNDKIGALEWFGYDDGEGSNKYAELVGTALDVSAGSEDGTLAFKVLVAGSDTEMMDINKTAAATITMQEIVNLADHDGATKGLKLGGTLVTSNATEINKLDAGVAGSSVALADADSILIGDATASNELKKVLLSDIKTYIGYDGGTVNNASSGGTLVVGTNYFGNHGGQITATMPGAIAPSVGDVVKIKAGGDCSSTNRLIVSTYADHTVDGQDSIILESPFAAVECVYVVSGSWRVF